MGTHANDEGQSQCKACPLGRTALKDGQAECDACQDGQYAVDPTVTCQDCDAIEGCIDVKCTTATDAWCVGCGAGSFALALYTQNKNAKKAGSHSRPADCLCDDEDCCKGRWTINGYWEQDADIQDKYADFESVVQTRSIAGVTNTGKRECSPCEKAKWFHILAGPR